MRTMKRIAAATAVVSALTMTAACGGSDSSDSAAGKASSAAPSAPRMGQAPAQQLGPVDIAQVGGPAPAKW